MSIDIEYVVRCDKCGSVYDWRQFQSKRDALLQVVSDGWKPRLRRVTGRKKAERILLCPSCAKGENK